jgi:TPP-dependent pyruvate/acetoin dehydrogenase alpha subunit
MKLPDKTKLKELYEKMVLTRNFEEQAARLFAEGKVHGTAHFCIGEEATGVGVTAALEPQDLMAATHRGHNQSIGKGMDIKLMMAEFLGKANGYCKGRGGCMHIADFSVGSLGANGIVGGGIPIAVGAGLSTRMKKIDRIVVSFFGDGAANEGAFHESLNLASVWKLPVLFVCVNNYYGMSMHVHKSMNIRDISVRASSYGIPGRAIDGNDILEVYNTALEAREHVRTQGPMLLVANTYRWMGHSKSDAQAYRSKEEVEEWKKRCPISRFRKLLLEKKQFTAAELEAIDEAARERILEAVAFAEESPDPPLEYATADVYTKMEVGPCAR